MRFSCAIVLFACALLLSGCSGTPVMTPSSTGPVPGTVLKGMVHGGQNPIVGASVYLYAVNNTGYGSANASISLLNSSGSNTYEDTSGNYYVMTDPNGDFTITGDYTCPSAYAQLYLYAVGGNPGLGSGNNSAITLMGPVSPCPSGSEFIVVNEVSTIASAYAFAGFTSDPTHLSSSDTALATNGTANAAFTLANIEDANTGQANLETGSLNGTVPQAEINTLANILAACVNSTGPGSTQCMTLFSNAMNGSTAPTDTATAAVNIAHNPALTTTAIGNLFNLQSGTSPFQPSLTAAPNDFTIAVNMTGFSGPGVLNEPTGIAIDYADDVWVANTGQNDLVEFSFSISSLNGPEIAEAIHKEGGVAVNEPTAIAIDGSTNVWVSNHDNNSIEEYLISFDSGGADNFTGGGLDGPGPIAVDASNHIWVGNEVHGTGQSSGMSGFNSSGDPLAGSPFTGCNLVSTGDIAIDVSGDVWVANPNSNAICEFNSSGVPNVGDPFTGGGLSTPYGLAIDGGGNVWAANPSSLSELNSSGAVVSPSGYSGGGLSDPIETAIDGAGNIWLANVDVNGVNSSISEFNPSGSPVSGSKGYRSSALTLPAGIAIDGSGDLWVSNVGTSTNPGNNIVEFIGAAAPVVTPIVANLRSPYGSHAVNLP